MKNIHSKKSISTLIGLLTVTLSVPVLLGCKSSPSSNGNDSTPAYTAVEKVTRGPDEISVMTFNIENTFDTVHDAGVEDYTYLPLSAKNTPEVQSFCNAMSNTHYRSECLTKNWDEAAMNFKLSQVAKVISYVDGGKGPDNLLLSEVENINVLTLLVKNHLAHAGYKTIAILKGPDTRGINTAFISKFPLVGQPILHIIPFQDADPVKEQKARRSRGILEATVRINNRDVTFLSAHFPSQANPTEWRRQAMEFMKNLMLDMQSKGRAVIAGGDLNTIPEEENDYGYFSKILAQAGSVSHFVGCKSCQGTHNYKGEWSFLDVIAYSNNLPQAAGLNLIPESIEVVKVPVHIKKNGTPLRFDDQKKEGVSDHLPLYSKLKVL